MTSQNKLVWIAVKSLKSLQLEVRRLEIEIIPFEQGSHHQQLLEISDVPANTRPWPCAER